MSEIYRQHKIWKKKEVLQKVYEDIYNRMNQYIKPGFILEIGSGAPNFKKNSKKVIYTDIQNVPWVDIVSDAHHLPFGSQKFGNILMIDVLHHLHSPIVFFEEASKTLKAGGRIIMVEPAITKISAFFYKYFHSEPMNLNINVFEEYLSSEDPYDSNQAIPTLLFKNAARFEKLISNFKIITKKEFGIITYPLSGGYRSWALLPVSMYPLLHKIERCLETSLSPYMGFRMLVVLEKKNNF